MSAVLTPTAPAATPTPVGPLKVTQTRVVRSEWMKFRSLRSTLYTLLAAVALTIGIGALFSGVTASQYHTFSAADKAAFNPISTSLTGISFSVSLVTSFISFFVGQALLSSHHLNVAITAPDALRSVIGAALYVTVAGLIGVALGALLRNTAAGISTFAAAFFVIPPLTGLLPASVSNHLAQYLPSNAGEALWGGTHGVTNVLSPWTGFAVLCGYAVILIAAGAWRLRRADA
jgi:hypothetical protein